MGHPENAQTGEHSNAVRRRAVPPAVAFDLPVGVLLLVCWFTVAVTLAHLITGLALICVIALHLATRRRWWRRPATPRRAVATRMGHGLLVVLTAAMAVSGLLRWAGVPPQFALHATSSYVLLSVVAMHLWVVRRPLRARLRTRRRTPARCDHRHGRRECS